MDLGNLMMEVRGDTFTFTYTAPGVALPVTGRVRPVVRLTYDARRRAISGVGAGLDSRYLMSIYALPPDMQATLQSQADRPRPEVERRFGYPIEAFCRSAAGIGGRPMPYEQYMRLAEAARERAARDLTDIRAVAEAGMYFPVSEDMYRELAGYCEGRRILGGASR